jgi:hypothetical protein
MFGDHHFHRDPLGECCLLDLCQVDRLTLDHSNEDRFDLVFKLAHPNVVTSRTDNSDFLCYHKAGPLDEPRWGDQLPAIDLRKCHFDTAIILSS